MKKTYIVKKDPGMPCREDNWIIMNGFEFAMFMRTDEGKARSRDFGKLYADGADDGLIIIECGSADAAKWRNEHDLYMYRQECLKNITVYSLDAFDTEEDGIPDTVMLADRITDVEEYAVRRDELRRLREILRSMDEDLLEVIYCLYLKDEPDSEQEIARSLGISQAAVSKRKKKALELLRRRLK